MAKKKVDKAREITFEGGLLHGKTMRVVFPYPAYVKMNLGRDAYVWVEGKAVFRYDPDWAPGPTTTTGLGSVG
jgi:hypothetical protein